MSAVFRASRALSAAKPSAMMDTFSNWYIKASGYREYGTLPRAGLVPIASTERIQAAHPLPQTHARPDKCPLLALS